MSNQSSSSSDDSSTNKDIQDALDKKKTRFPESKTVQRPQESISIDRYGQIVDPQSEQKSDNTRIQASTADTSRQDASKEKTSEETEIASSPHKTLKPVPPPVVMPRSMAVGAAILLILLLVAVSILIGMFVLRPSFIDQANAISTESVPIATAGGTAASTIATTVPVAAVADTSPTTPIAATAGGTSAGTTAPVATPTANPDDKDYNAGQEQAKNEHWKEAVILFEQVYAKNPKYINIQESLAGSLYNLGYNEMRDAVGKTLIISDINAIEEHFKRSSQITPPRDPAPQWIIILETYKAGREANERKEWKAALQSLDDRAKLPFTFEGVKILDTPNQVYTAYLGRAKELADAGDIDGARQRYEQAKALQEQGVADVSEALEGLNKLPTPTAVPEPTAIPAPTRVPVRVFRANPTLSFPNSGNANEFNSCVQGRVTDRNARGIDGARLGVNNGPKNQFLAATSGGGYYVVCGLGASNWTAVLFFIPGNPKLGNQPNATVYVNGSPSQRAVVNFLER